MKVMLQISVMDINDPILPNGVRGSRFEKVASIGRNDARGHEDTNRSNKIKNSATDVEQCRENTFLGQTDSK